MLLNIVDNGRRWRQVFFCCALLMTICSAHADQTARDKVSFSTPPGITLVDVVYEIFLSKPLPLWTHLAGPHGETLYVFDEDKAGSSACTGACAEEFPPVIALPGAKPYGDWTLVQRAAGDQQWAYRDKPLYRFARETQIDEVVANLVTEQFKKSSVDLISSQANNEDTTDQQKALLPPEGWQIAKFTPAPGMVLPAAIGVQEIPAAGLLGLVDYRGHTLYAFDGEPDTESGSQCWQPLIAPEVVGPVGDFAPSRRTDGRRQWTWQDVPLYTCNADRIPGQINGVFSALNPEADRGWYIPSVATHFTPHGIKVRKDRVRGQMLSTTQGMPLYTRQPDKLLSSDRLNFFQNYYRGKRLGAKGCNAECEKNWLPLVAPDEAQSQGYWEVVIRDDGLRQWSYKGFLQYTYSKDNASGLAGGNNIYDYVIGNDGPYKPADVIPDYGKFSLSYIAYPGLVWRLSSP